MIPASYLFRDLYRQRFEMTPEQALEAAERRGLPIRGRGPLDVVTAAIAGFALGAPSFTLDPTGPNRQARRR